MRGFHTTIERVAYRRAIRARAPSFDDYAASRQPDEDGSKLLSRFQMIDGNIAGLLTHVSAMIAATGLLLIVSRMAGGRTWSCCWRCSATA